ncbi:HYR domain-containing protein [Deinococcus sp. KSM4-11]|uniref:HYR domain-containing protein n=1 Tax=Deinococcus sp. KSM4-11 TaxID=2568654 RepID=UPI001454CD4A|nr:HYR domain-containing protein [Deinococcus sp. KSM4-11]
MPVGTMYATQVIIEERLGSAPGTILATTPVDFLIRIVTGTPPVFTVTSPFPTNGQVFTAPVGHAFTQQVQAVDPDFVSGNAAVDIDELGFPAGATLDACTSTAGTTTCTVNWTPTQADAGKSFVLALTAHDTSGLGAAPYSFTVNVPANTAPTLHLPAPITVEATSATGAIVTYSATATDAEDATAPDITCTPPSNSTFALGQTTVTCSATDSNGTKSTGTFTVTVADTTPPVLSNVPAAFAIEATGPNGAAVTFTAPSANDAVDPTPSVSCDPASGTTLSVAVHTVTCTATDARGNHSDASFVVTVTDTTKPTLTLPATIVKEATSAAGAAVTFTATATDIVDGTLTVTCTPASGSTFALGDTSVTCSATDAHNNKATGTFTVTVQDKTKPVVTVPANQTLEATGPSGAIATFSASATDIVDGTLTATCDPASGSTFALGATTVNCSATDAAGNKGTGSFTVTVQDTTKPVLSLPSPLTVEAANASGANVSFTATANDLVSGSRPVNCTPNSGSTFALGTTTVNCNATDTASNTSTGSFTVTVKDSTAPTLGAHAGITAEATGPAGAAVTYTAPAASDAVDGSPTVTCLPASGTTFALGTTSVACTAKDASGNMSPPSTFSVTVQDTTAPAITGVPADITVNAANASGAVVTYVTPTASDLVDGARTVTCTPASGSTFPIGSTTVTCKSADSRGNSASKTFAVNVRDTVPPVLSLPANIVTNTAANGQAIVNFTATANDAVSGPAPVTCTPPSGSTFNVGVNTVTCTAKDAAGNQATGTFTVTVRYAFDGFYQPIDMNGVLNSVKAGSAIPVKFSLGGNQGLDIFALNSPSSVGNTCGTAPVDDVEQTVTAGGSSLSYSGGGQYIYVWKTDPSWSGTCRKLTVTLRDGTSQFAYFKFK